MAEQVGVLFVCLGNICRSPTAAVIFRTQVEEAGLGERITAESAGTGAWHVGEGADRRATLAARRRGYDLSAHRARTVEAADFDCFDYVVAMDYDNLDSLLAIAPSKHHARVSLLLSYAPDCSEEEVPDPYYGGSSGFDRVITLIEQAAAGLLAEIVERRL